MDAEYVIQIILNGLVLSMVYILLALGLSMIFGIGRVFNFAHGEFFMLGGVLTYYLYQVAGINYVLTILLTIPMLALLGYCTERFVFRPLGEKVVSSMVIAFGLSMVLAGITLAVIGDQERIIRTVIQGKLEIFGAVITVERLVIIIVSLVLVIALYLFLKRTKLGWAIRAVAENPEGSALQGISVNGMRSLVFMMGASLAGVAGALMGPLMAFTPGVGHEVILKTAIVVIIGGMGSVPGAIIAGFVVGFTESAGYAWIGGYSATLLFSLVVLTLIVRPNGILGVPFDIKR